jgi:hypothetical protein
MTSVARKPVSLLRKIFGQVILVISGPGRRMYQNLAPKPEGTIFSKRSKPQGTDRTPHDATTIMAAESNIRGDIGHRRLYSPQQRAE